MHGSKQRSSKRKQPVRVLVVQDDVSLGESLRDGLRDWGAEVDWVRSLHEAYEACAQPFRLLVVDVQLPDGSGVTLAERAAQMRPVPMILAVSDCNAAREVFRMAQLGAVGFLQKPFERGELLPILEQLFDDESGRLPMMVEPDYMPHMVAVVGRTNFREVLDRVRRCMAEQALAMAAGNKTGAARLLGITRQAVQQLIRDLDLSDSQQPPAFDADAVTGEVPVPESLPEASGARRCN